VSGGLKLEKPIKKREDVRKALLNAFNRRMGAYIEQIMMATESLAEAVGAKRVPVSDDLVKFTKALDLVPDLKERYNYYALTGYNASVQAKATRETFLSTVKHVCAAIEKLQKNKDYADLRQLKDMNAAWTGFSQLVREFSAKFAEGFGAIVPTNKGNVAGGVEGEEENSLEGAEQLADMVGGGVVEGPELAKVAYNLERAKHVIKYFVRIGLIQSNMANMEKESKEYSKDYTKVLGDAVANLRDQNVELKTKQFKLLGKDVVANPSALGAALDEEEVKRCKETISFFRNADDKMFMAAEAIDLYLMHFTDSLVAHPNDIESLHTMLKTTDTLSKWYSATSGNLICAVFESFDKSNGLTELLKDKKNSGMHYYEMVGALGAAKENAKLDAVLSGSAKGVAETLFKDTHTVFDNVLALKNIMSAFFHIGDKFGGESLRKKIHMRPVEIYNTLVDYMTASSFSLAGDSVATPASLPALLDIKLRNVSESKTVDKLFEYSIKGIVAKILTVIGTYNMLHRPVDSNGLGYQSDIRLTLGAGESSAPVVHDEAMELYVRLPLLAEWYREVFNFFTTNPLRDTKTSTALKISMVPEVDGLYAGLINMIFDSARHVASGIYSDIEAKQLIHEINKIYTHHKGNKDPIMASVQGLVDEINRRYGVLESSERKAYKDEYARRYDPLSGPTGPEDINYAILPDGEETDIPRRSAPSDSYMQRGADAESYLPKHKWGYDASHKKHVDALRYIVGKKLESAKPYDSNTDQLDNLRSVSFEGSIRARAEELTHAKSQEQRFKVVLNSINAFGEFSYSAIERTILLFHETVVLGLESLSAVYALVGTFNESVEALFQRAQGNGAALVSGDFLSAIELLYAHGNDLGGLVNVRMEAVATGAGATDTKLSVHVDHSKLREVVEQQIMFIKTALDRFRGLVPKQVMDKYELVSTPGSVYDMELKFISQLFNGTAKNATGTNEPKNDTLDNCTRKLKEVFSSPAFLGKPLATLRDLVMTPGAAVGAFLPGATTGTSQGLNIFLRDMSLAKKGTAVPLMSEFAGGGKGVGLYLYDPVDTTLVGAVASGGVVTKFNQLLALYLRQFFNEANERVYASVINHIANGVFSEEVVKAGAKNFDQCIDDTAAGGSLVALSEGKILAKSLAFVMFNMVNGKASGQRELYFLENDLAEVPEFMREKFRADMPIFCKLFESLSARCDLLKQVTKVVDTAGEQSKILLTLDRVMQGCAAVCKCIKTVLGELSDEPQYLETRQHSIKDYAATNGSEAFMPLSSVSYYLGAALGAYEPKFFPGNASFKLQYGTRGILCGGDTSLKAVPGMKSILARHNESSEGEYHFTESELASHVTNTITLLKYVIDLKHCRGLVSPVGSGHYSTNAFVMYPLHTWALKASGMAATGANPTVLQVVELTESSHQNEQRLKLVNHVGRHEDDMLYGDRDSIRNKNIIDMNITPININALRREIPFLNLYNYSWTFDSMICDLLDVSKDILYTDDFSSVVVGSGQRRHRKHGGGQYTDARVRNEDARKFLAWLTTHPYDTMAQASTFMGLSTLDPVSVLLPGTATATRSTKSQLPARWATENAKTAKPVNVEDLKFDVAYEQGLRDASLKEQKVKVEGGASIYANRRELWDENFSAIMRGAIGVEGLGRPKFLSEELFNKALFGEVYDGSSASELGPGARSSTASATSLHYSTAVAPSATQASRHDVKTVTVKADTLHTLGWNRFNTRFARHLIWVVNIQRLLRLKMHRDLMWHTTKITRDVAVLAPGNTELYDNDVAGHDEMAYKY
jgi:hypothetical protein